MRSLREKMILLLISLFIWNYFLEFESIKSIIEPGEKSMDHILARSGMSVKILFWNPNLKGHPELRYSAKKCLAKCLFLPCRLVVNRTHESDADAILFSWYERSRFQRMPNRSNYEQMWLFMSKERPMVTTLPNHYDQYRPLFNWTMTYSTDSDIHYPYYTLYYRYIRERDAEMIQSIVTTTKEKTRIGVWFVTNKIKAYQRYNYMRELAKHISVDIYGPKEALKCPKNISSACSKFANANYKFFFSFENNIVKDYLTEKVYDHLSKSALPVVFGGGNYKQLLPPHSYIDASYYSSPKKLAEYLHLLNNNDHLYLEYFEWLARGKWHLLAPQWCNLCLNLLIRNENTYSSYGDIYNWFYDNTTYIVKDDLPSRSEIDELFSFQ